MANISIESLGVPKNSEWGPVLWQLLHGVAQQIGKTPVKQMLTDQRREFILVLRYIENIMPCPLCRQHYHQWRFTHPIDKFPDGQEFFTSVRQWLFELHENVNKSRNIESGISLESLSTLYKTIDLKQKLGELSALLERAVRLRAVESEKVKSFQKHFTFLIRFL